MILGINKQGQVNFLHSGNKTIRQVIDLCAPELFTKRSLPLKMNITLKLFFLKFLFWHILSLWQMFIITFQFLCKKATVLIGLQLWNSVKAKQNSAKTTDLTLEQANMLNFTSAKKKKKPQLNSIHYRPILQIIYQFYRNIFSTAEI